MSEKQAAEREEDLARQLLELVGKLAGELHPNTRVPENLDLHSRLDSDLAFDSLGRVELIHRVEQSFGVSLDEAAFAKVATVGDLLCAVLASRGDKPAFEREFLTSLSVGEVADTPAQAKTLVDVLHWHLARHPQRPLIEIYQDSGHGDVITYDRLASMANKVAWCLLDGQLGQGARVTLMLPTDSRYFFSFMGVLIAGAVPVPIYPPMRLSQIESYIRRHQIILKNCRAEIMITTREIQRYSLLLKSLVPSLRQVLCAEDFDRYPARPVKLAPNEEDIAFIQYTSGSTSEPKGVLLSHRNLLANIRAMGEASRVSSREVFVSWLPLYHDMGLIGAWLSMFYFSGYLVVMSPLEFLARPQRWLWAIHRHRATLSAAPNFAYDLCIHKLAEAELAGLDLSSWRLACNGAEPVIPDTVRGFCERFARYGFKPQAYWPVYGLAEASVGLAFPKPGQAPVIQKIQREPFTTRGQAVPADPQDPHALEFVCCGRVLAGHEMRVVDDQDRELPDRQQGHLQFKGPSATRGYLDAPDKTRALFHGQWLDTGDLAYLDEGQLFLTGRSKDIIIRAGRNIYPHEIEEAVGALSGVRRGRVVAFGHADAAGAKERLVVLVETRESDPERRQALHRDIMAACADIVDLPPDEILLAPPNTVLKTSSGKLRRSACRALYLEGKIGQQPPPVWWQLGRIILGGLGEQARKQWRRLKTLAYGGYAWFLYLALAVLACPLLLLLPTLRLRQRLAHLASRLLAWASATPLRVSGLEKLEPGQDYIFVANHSSYLDPYVLLAALGLPFRFVAKGELAGNRLLAMVLKRFGVEFVERFDVEKSVSDAKKLGQTPGSLLFFPEGTFSRIPGLGRFHMGAFLEAARSGRPIVPVSIKGARFMLREQDWLPRRGQIEVVLGEPMAAEPGEAHWQAATRLKNQARAAILAHCGEPDLET
ncbi:AMP-binding protein [Gallaecimonas sp. GXIMD4217]|uniref:AMP-binding protein n=1 Tax=Gallaecimonas sp. GXIMD4217 TaxID=3131927 RepID=UPI00311AC59F